MAKVFPKAQYDFAPMADGGEGTVEAMVRATGGRFITNRVCGPVGVKVQARYGILGDGKTAVIEMASASGLPLVKPQERNPMRTTTFGTGELIRSALDQGVKRIVIGIGGSATVDGGAGAMQALGARLLDGNGKALRLGGGALNDLAAVDMSGFDPRAGDMEILVACDVDNPLTGPKGAAVVYGPQKGATDEMLPRLDANLKHYAEVLKTALGVDVDQAAGAGAAGGLGAGLMAFCGAKLQSGSKLVADAIGLDQRLAGSALCVTGEGQLDGSSRFGKVCFRVAEVASRHNVPTIALVGSIGAEAETTVPPISAFFSIVNRAMDLKTAFHEADHLLEQLAEQVARTLQAGGHY